MYITVQVQQDVAPMVSQPQRATGAGAELLSIARELGITLEPLHPGTQDPTLATFFTVKVPDEASAERVIERLRQSRAVEAAYVKPPDALP